MNLYLIRHGKAEPKSGKINDSDRRLTQEGIRIVRNATHIWENFIRHEGIDIIVTSPLARAVQTAEIIHDEFKVDERIITDNSLLNGGNLKDILSLVVSFEKNNIALVGHQPDLSGHISKLISSHEINLRLKPASIVQISFDNGLGVGKGVLEFLIPSVHSS